MFWDFIEKAGVFIKKHFLCRHKFTYETVECGFREYEIKSCSKCGYSRTRKI